MLENEIELTISLSDTQLDETALQTIISQNLLPEIQRIEGVKKVDLIPIKEAPEGSKSLAGYLLGKFRAFVNIKNVKTIITWLSKNIRDKDIEITAKKIDKDGNSKEITLKLNRAEDIQIIMPEIDNFIHKKN